MPTVVLQSLPSITVILVLPTRRLPLFHCLLTFITSFITQYLKYGVLNYTSNRQVKNCDFKSLCSSWIGLFLKNNSQNQYYYHTLHVCNNENLYICYIKIRVFLTKLIVPWRNWLTALQFSFTFILSYSSKPTKLKCQHENIFLV